MGAFYNINLDYNICTCREQWILIEWQKLYYDFNYYYYYFLFPTIKYAIIY